jgi:hypothetical protein
VESIHLIVMHCHIVRDRHGSPTTTTARDLTQIEEWNYNGDREGETEEHWGWADTAPSNAQPGPVNVRSWHGHRAQILAYHSGGRQTKPLQTRESGRDSALFSD